MQPEYLETRRTKVTIYNVPMDLLRNVLASFLCDYDWVEEVTVLRGGCGMASCDYSFLCVNREGFQAILDTIRFKKTTHNERKVSTEESEVVLE